VAFAILYCKRCYVGILSTSYALFKYRSTYLPRITTLGFLFDTLAAVSLSVEVGAGDIVLNSMHRIEF